MIRIVTMRVRVPSSFSNNLMLLISDVNRAWSIIQLISFRFTLITSCTFSQWLKSLETRYDWRRSMPVLTEGMVFIHLDIILGQIDVNGRNCVRAYWWSASTQQIYRVSPRSACQVEVFHNISKVLLLSFHRHSALVSLPYTSELPEPFSILTSIEFLCLNEVSMSWHSHRGGGRIHTNWDPKVVMLKRVHRCGS